MNVKSNTYGGIIDRRAERKKQRAYKETPGTSDTGLSSLYIKLSSTLSHAHQKHTTNNITHPDIQPKPK